MINKKCKVCGKQFKVFKSRQHTAKFCSQKCKYIGQKGLLCGSNNPMWKGDNVGYKAIHDWLYKHYGNAYKCDNPSCKGLSNKFEWSLKKGFRYSHKRGNYWMLCTKCHRAYDKTEESKRKTSQTLKGHKSWNNWENIARDSLGKFSK